MRSRSGGRGGRGASGSARRLPDGAARYPEVRSSIRKVAHRDPRSKLRGRSMVSAKKESSHYMKVDGLAPAARSMLEAAWAFVHENTRSAGTKIPALRGSRIELLVARTKRSAAIASVSYALTSE